MPSSADSLPGAEILSRERLGTFVFIVLVDVEICEGSFFIAGTHDSKFLTLVRRDIFRKVVYSTLARVIKISITRFYTIPL